MSIESSTCERKPASISSMTFCARRSSVLVVVVADVVDAEERPTLRYRQQHRDVPAISEVSDDHVVGVDVFLLEEVQLLQRQFTPVGRVRRDGRAGLQMRPRDRAKDALLRRRDELPLGADLTDDARANPRAVDPLA